MRAFADAADLAGGRDEDDESKAGAGVGVEVGKLADPSEISALGADGDVGAV